MINTNNSRNTNNEVSETINSLLTSSKRDLIKKEFKTTIKPNNLNLLLDDTNIIKKTGSLKKKINGNSYISSKSYEEDLIAKNKLAKTFVLFNEKKRKKMEDFLKKEISENSNKSESSNNSNSKSSSMTSSKYSSSESSEDDFEKDNRKLIKREKICDTDSEDSESEDEKKKVV